MRVHRASRSARVASTRSSLRMAIVRSHTIPPRPCAPWPQRNFGCAAQCRPRQARRPAYAATNRHYRRSEADFSSSATHSTWCVVGEGTDGSERDGDRLRSTVGMNRSDALTCGDAVFVAASVRAGLWTVAGENEPIPSPDSAGPVRPGAALARTAARFSTPSTPPRPSRWSSPGRSATAGCCSTSCWSPPCCS